MIAQSAVTLGDLADHSLVQVLAAAAILAAVRSLWRISKAVTVELPRRLTEGDQRMGHIETDTRAAASAASAAHAEAARSRSDLLAHMATEEAEMGKFREAEALWRSQVADKIDAVRADLMEEITGVRKASVASWARLITAIEQGEPVGRATPQSTEDPES